VDQTRLIVASAFQALPFTDSATGLVYARERWLDPRTGTFMTQDPVGYRDSSNLYSFCGGDPLNCRDPQGLQVRSDSRASVASQYPPVVNKCPTGWEAGCDTTVERALRSRFDDAEAPIYTITVPNSKRSPVVFVTGILNDATAAQENARVLAHHVNRSVELIHNVTYSFGRDVGQSASNKLGVRDEPTRALVAHIRNRLATLPKGELLDVVGHSQGTIIVSTALFKLEPHERSKIAMTAYAPAARTFPKDLAWRRLIINIRDPIPLLGPYFHVWDSTIEYTSFHGPEYVRDTWAHSFAAYIADERVRKDPARLAKEAAERRAMVARNLERRGW
jgi:RHS repeat-associated protein